MKVKQRARSKEKWAVLEVIKGVFNISSGRHGQKSSRKSDTQVQKRSSDVQGEFLVNSRWLYNFNIVTVARVFENMNKFNAKILKM